MEQATWMVTQRRLRNNTAIRELSSSVKLSHKSFIQPLFVAKDADSNDESAMIPTHNSYSIAEVIAADMESGINKFLLFPVPAQKMESGFDYGFISHVIAQLKQQFGDNIWLAADVCLCGYTSHGHCGILNAERNQVCNHETVLELVKYSLLLAEAGADCIAPSDMMDGRIAAIRKGLDGAGFDVVNIMSYSSKFASQWYGPFRDICKSTPTTNGLRNRKTYQHSPFQPAAAIEASLRDEKEGADILMVKPSMMYADIIYQLKQLTRKPIAAYQVSGEYAAIEMMAENNLLNREAGHMEAWAALQRSGADIIISYAARHAKQWIEQYEY
jgi:porphobilinogen synthase